MIGSNKLTRVGLAWSGLLLVSLFGLLSILGLEQLVRALLASVAYYMIPTGVGLLLLPGPTTWRVAGLREGERLLAAYFAGLVALTLLYVIRDRYGFAHNHRLGIDLGALFLAIVGWCLERRRASRTVKLLLTSRHALLAFSVYLVGYAVQFFILSDYPRTDLFQFTHILKATEEFLKWDRLNPFVADSYIPAIPVMLRLVTELTGAESLSAIWVLSLGSFVVRWMAIFMLIRRLPHMHRHAGLVAAVALPFFLSGIPTNGELVSLGCCLILGLSLASMQSPQKSHRWLPLLVMPLSLMLEMVLSSTVDVALYGGFALVAALTVSFFAVHRNGGALVVLGLMCFLMTPLHRSAGVFFFVAVTSAAGLSNFASRYWLNPWVVRIILAMVLASVGAVLLRWLGVVGTPDIGISLAEAAKDSLGIDFLTDANRSVGVGSKIALFEVSRAVGLMLCFFGFIGLLKAQPNRHLLSYQFVAGGLLLLLVQGFPFAYRAAFFLPIFLACILVCQFRESSPREQWMTGSAIAIYAIGLLSASAMVYANGGVASGGQGRIAPVLLCIAMVAALALLVMRANRVAAMTLFGAILIAATLIDRQFTRAQFMHYAYPRATSGVDPISHYDANDLAMAAALNKIPGEIVVISDPLTMANMRGLGGHNSILHFTNLDTGSVGAKSGLHRYLKKIASPARYYDTVNCPTISETIQVLAAGHAPDFTYTLLWLNSLHVSGKDILRKAGYSNSLRLAMSGRPDGIVGTLGGKSTADWYYLIGLVPEQKPSDTKIRFAVVMNNRTVEWAATATPISQTYFFGENSLNSSVFQRLGRECNAIVTADSAIVIFDFNGNIFNAP